LRSIIAAAGLVSLPLALIAHGGTVYFHAMKQFSRMSKGQGDPAEGWSFPWEYLWHAEHLLLVAWVAALAAALLMMREKLRREARIWILAVLWIYFALAFSSAGVGVFGIFGRQVRQMVPFLCLVTAAVHTSLGLTPVQNRLLTLALALQFGFNVWEPLTQRFP